MGAGTGGSIKGPAAGASGGAAGVELLEDAAAAAPAAAAEAPPMFDTKRARALFSAARLASSAIRFVAAFLCFEAPPSFAPRDRPIAPSKRPAKDQQKTSQEWSESHMSVSRMKVFAFWG